jgi:hypothetical protein
MYIQQITWEAHQGSGAEEKRGVGSDEDLGCMRVHLGVIVGVHVEVRERGRHCSRPGDELIGAECRLARTPAKEQDKSKVNLYDAFPGR